MTVSYTNLFGDHGDGCAKRTVKAGDDMHVDLDDQDRVIGVETYGDSADWTQALVRLAMAGRLAVPKRGALP